MLPHQFFFIFPINVFSHLTDYPVVLCIVLLTCFITVEHSYNVHILHSK